MPNRYGAYITEQRKVTNLASKRLVIVTSWVDHAAPEVNQKAPDTFSKSKCGSAFCHGREIIFIL